MLKSLEICLFSVEVERYWVFKAKMWPYDSLEQDYFLLELQQSCSVVTNTHRSIVTCIRVNQSECSIAPTCGSTVDTTAT